MLMEHLLEQVFMIYNNEFHILFYYIYILLHD